MTKIYSRVQPDMLLHIIHRCTDFSSDRNDLVEPENFLQCAALNLNRGRSFKAHKHIIKSGGATISQEAWVVIYGSVRCILYDIDDTIIVSPVLQAGDCSITLRGAHNYEAITECKVLEFKSGPYYGQEQDKEFIG